MNISIFQSNNNDISAFNVKENKGSVNFDTCGNTYIEYNSKVYQICISKKNDIYLDYADYSILSTESPEYGHIIESSSESNNTERVADVIEPEDDHNDYSDDENYDENDPYGAVGDNYYIEEKNYMFSVPTSDYSTPQFYFCKASGTNDILVNQRNNGDVNALYDTFIYNNEKCTFRSKLIGEPPFYVVKLYDDHISLRDIYDINNCKYYKIVFDGSNINLVRF